jgi:hypothetical protein
VSKISTDPRDERPYPTRDDDGRLVYWVRDSNGELVRTHEHPMLGVELS